ncbi:hypothetical protein [Bosea sp. BH3]|uniref:hypothetical protein n=1 Tax=Bosea sp. BH3 TaxID=2871701 RepID=UPI0021CB8D99|nr:hypothetical protein [Bosea sp. BH3]MCU4181418.1 hypothetical protein [Bosea sp. BH3]
MGVSIEPGMMKFRYVAFWFYWSLASAGLFAFIMLSTAVSAGLKMAVPSLLEMQPLFVAAVIALTLAAAYPIATLALRVHERIHWLYPAHRIAMNQRGIAFDLPLGISGSVDWRDVASVDYCPGRFWYVAVEFKRKQPLGPAGLEKELDRLLLRGDRILPSGRAFLKAARHYHAIASGRPHAGEDQGEPRPSILRRLAWTFRRPAR